MPLSPQASFPSDKPDAAVSWGPHPSAFFILNEVRSDVLRQYLSCHGSLRLTVRGGSMHPFLTDGDDVLVVPLAGRDAAVGDVVVGVTGGHLVCHRVVRRRVRALITAGDATGRQDGPMSFEDCLGRVVAASQGRPRLFFRPEPALGKGFFARLWFSLGKAVYRCAQRIR
jgi:hypothetical protein